jgi:hypothetical protein
MNGTWLFVAYLYAMVILVSSDRVMDGAVTCCSLLGNVQMAFFCRSAPRDISSDHPAFRASGTTPLIGWIIR